MDKPLVIYKKRRKIKINEKNNNNNSYSFSGTRHCFRFLDFLKTDFKQKYAGELSGKSARKLSADNFARQR